MTIRVVKMRLIPKRDFFKRFLLVGKAFLNPFFFGGKKVRFKPSFISLAVEDGCNLRCLHCDIWKNKKNVKRMNLAQMKQTVDKLEAWLGDFQLNLTGGEPFLNRDIIPLIKYATQKDIFVHINSNGFLIDQNKAKKIIDSRLDSLSISLDSLNPALHNRLRGNKKAFHRATKAIKSINKIRQGKKLFFSLTTIMMRDNLSELPDLVKWVKDNGLDSIFFQPLWHNFGTCRYDPLWFKKSQLWPEHLTDSKRVLDELIKLKKKSYPIGNSLFELKEYKSYFADPLEYGKHRNCYVGMNSFNIDISGAVRFCFDFAPVGNILKLSPGKIWNGEKAQALRKKIASCQRGCKVLLCNMPMGKRLASNLLFKLSY